MTTNKTIIDSILGRTSSTLNRLLLQSFKENDISITPERWSILAILWEEDGCSQQELATKTYRDKPAITRLIDNLEKEQFIVRKPHKNDRRLKLVFLTKKGVALQKEVSRVIDKIIKKATMNILEEELISVQNTLDKIYFNLTVKNENESK